MQNNNFDIQQGRLKHFLYKSKLRSVLYGSDVEEGFFGQRTGPFGEWLYNKGMVRYAHMAEMREIERLHKEISVFVNDLIYMYKRGKMQQARDGLAKMENYSQKLLALLDSLERRL
ncbi:MAG: hypothetical protein EOP53_16835 [Sphingobacteriales bacterium]|nr:MAG: hypothetical protein EOP53_16835 [Sphingobacteriales bacterium]